MLSLHIHSGEWSSPNITGQPPSPFSLFTLTQVGERRAALFGGWSGSGALSDLFVFELSRHTVVSVVRKHYYYGVLLVSKVTHRNKTYAVSCKTYEVGCKTYEVVCKTYEVVMRSVATETYHMRSVAK